MVKNQHLLVGLVVLGAVNLVAFLSLLFGERESARLLKGLERDVAASRDDQRRIVESVGLETAGLRKDVEQVQSIVVQLRGEIDRMQGQLDKTRKALEAMTERTDRTAAPARVGRVKEQGQ
jgi:TolA-binding protein